MIAVNEPESGIWHTTENTDCNESIQHYVYQLFAWALAWIHHWNQWPIFDRQIFSKYNMYLEAMFITNYQSA